MKRKIILLLLPLFFLNLSLKATWCDVCGRVISNKKYTLTLPNNKTRHYCSIFCKAKDIKRFGFKNDINITQKQIKNFEQYWQTVKNKKIYNMGKKIYQDRCKKVEDLDLYIDISDLEKDLKTKYCYNLTNQRVWMVAVYLWDKFYNNILEQNSKTIKVTKDEKCPVCGMFVYKYPRWAAQIWFKDKKHHSFDGVKCLTKYLHTHKNIKIKQILVTDYYTQQAINGQKAFYVIGSDVYGPMGEEAIPFKTLQEAKRFLKDHRGKKILKLNEVKF